MENQINKDVPVVALVLLLCAVGISVMAFILGGQPP